tara:strand:- start:618 stop:1019 length:402 start_codon:yes stop_codon:yes gene_type:complete
MTYDAKIPMPAIGYIQASAIVTSNLEDVEFDIPNDMQTEVQSGRTELFSDSLVIMSLSRDDDSIARSSTYHVNSSQQNPRYRGRIPGEVTNYFQTSEFAFDYTSHIEPHHEASAGDSTISFTQYSHAKIWRIS